MEGVPNERAINISPNCLNVDKATIFLASTSNRADKLATVNVRIPNVPHNIMFSIVVDLNRIINHTPAVTRVEL